MNQFLNNTSNTTRGRGRVQDMKFLEWNVRSAGNTPIPNGMSWRSIFTCKSRTFWLSLRPMLAVRKHMKFVNEVGTISCIV